jgi:hypothetical protein
MAKDFVKLSIRFFRSHWIDISLASLGIFLIVSYIIVNNITIDPPRSLKKGRTIVIEPFQSTPPPLSPGGSDPSGVESANKMIQDAWCKSGAQTHTLEEKCATLSPAVCQETECCVYAYQTQTAEAQYLRDRDREASGLTAEDPDYSPYGYDTEAGFSCVAGNGDDGPTYKGDADGNYYSYDYWYYLGQKYS